MTTWLTGVTAVTHFAVLPLIESRQSVGTKAYTINSFVAWQA